ncbi:translation initiation factor IF-2-like [Melozone crissalis]|uniref:translation initiation factor IF-2-like n=1 Tax=Melozone crissalis TaxID=40204 RepID=UPI0023D9A177|nr:translation initiation factor IF-2-like [Melozone crissalis]
MSISDRHAGPAPAGPRSAASRPPSAPPSCPSCGRQRVALPSHRRGAAGAARERSGNAPGAGTEPGMHRERSGSGAGAGSGSAAPSWVAGGGGEGLLPYSSGGPHFPWTSFCFCCWEAFPHHLSVPGPEARSSAGINQLRFPVAEGGRKMHSGCGHNLPCLETGPLLFPE